MENYLKYSEVCFANGEFEVRKIIGGKERAFNKVWAVIRNGCDVGHETTKKRAVFICNNWKSV